MDYNARYYSPTLGRFISPDIIVPDPRNSQHLNRYSYVRNNPLKYTDPTGHKEDCEDPADCPDLDTPPTPTPITGSDTITIYVDQPIPGSPDAYNLDRNVGHTFIILYDEETGEQTVRGLYPDPEASVGPHNPEVDGYLKDTDATHSWDAKQEFAITDEGYEAAMAKILVDDKSIIYDLNSHNCTTWALDIISIRN